MKHSIVIGVFLVSCDYYNQEAYCNGDFEEHMIKDDQNCDGHLDNPIFALSQEDFESQTIIIHCSKMLDCMPEVGELLGYEDHAECVEVLSESNSETDSTECSYDSSKAQACLDELQASSCEDYTSGNTGDSCNEVLLCDEEDESLVEEEGPS